MIIIERQLTEPEKHSIAGLPLIDLQNTDMPTDENRKAILSWIDTTGAQKISGKTYSEFFSRGESSFWLHVRARIFYSLQRHAQLLDRLPDLRVLEKIETVFCEPELVDFWTFWCPHARIVRSNLAKVHIKSEGTHWIHRIAQLIRDGRKGWVTLRDRHEVICFSAGGYTEEKNGSLWDRHLGPLLKKNPEWLRLEYTPLPPKFEEQHLKLTSVHETVRTDGLLLVFTFKRPWLFLQMVLDRVRIWFRFQRKPDVDFLFPEPRSKWTSLLHNEIKRVGKSMALLRLYNTFFREVLREAEPLAVVAVSENNSIGRTLVDASRASRIPTFGVQHGSIDPHNIDYRFRESAEMPSRPDWFFTWGTATRDYLVNDSGYAPERTLAVGRLLSDSIGTPRPDSTVLNLKNQTGMRVVVFTSQAPGVFNEYRLKAAPLLAKFCREHGLACVVKLHPRESNGDIYTRAFAEAGVSERLLIHDGLLYEMIAAADFGSTCYSTTAWEFLWMKKPLILFDPFRLDLLHVRGTDTAFIVENDSSGFETWAEREAEVVASGYELAEEKLGPHDLRVAERMTSHIRSVYSDSSRSSSNTRSSA